MLLPVSSAAAFTASRHGFTFAELSIITPLPTWRLEPCGAGVPVTVK